MPLEKLFLVNPSVTIINMQRPSFGPTIMFSIIGRLAYWHDDVIKWKHFPRYCPFVRGIHWWPVNSPLDGQWRGALTFFLDLRLNKRLSKQSWGWWLETQLCSLWRHFNGCVKQQRIGLWAFELPGSEMRLPKWLYCSGRNVNYNLTHWGREEMEAIKQTTLSSAFFWKNMFKFRQKFHWSLFLRVQLTIFQHWFR